MGYWCSSSYFIEDGRWSNIKNHQRGRKSYFARSTYILGKWYSESPEEILNENHGLGFAVTMMYIIERLTWKTILSPKNEFFRKEKKHFHTTKEISGIEESDCWGSRMPVECVSSPPKHGRFGRNIRTRSTTSGLRLISKII